MIKPKIKTFKHPKTGAVTKIEEWPAIFIYGLTKEERAILGKSLPHPKVEILDITDVASDIITRKDFAVIINPDNIIDDELELFKEFYKDCDAYDEVVIFTKDKAGLKDMFPTVRCVIFADTFEFECQLKYELLRGIQRSNKAEGYSNSLSQAMRILFAIRNKPYITTKELAEDLERSPRTVQRYIETLRTAGEFIGYDNQKKGWFLLVDGKSVLLDEF